MKENEYRNSYCATLTKEDLDKEVKLSGWVENIRDHGGILFIDLRDATGIIQLVSEDDKLFADLTRESVISIEGKVIARKEDMVNEKLKTGEIEILTTSVNVLSKCKNNLPFEIKTSGSVNEELRLKYRFLDLRNKEMHDKIMFRSEVIAFIREFMRGQGFTEFQTPILTASSPEGARDFIVPSRLYKGKFYALPQAPQIFKQLLMVSGFDRYFQIAPCFRDEDPRADRLYGEFYQLDFEMSFATQEDVFDVGQKFFYDTFSKFGKKEVSPVPFKRIPYRESILKYGTDKPDLRNPLYIVDLTEELKDTTFAPFKDTVIRGIKVPDLASKPNSWFNEMVSYANTIGMPGLGYIKVNEDMTFAGPIDKFLTDEERKSLISKAELEANSVLFFIADKKNCAKLAGLIRIELGKKLELIDENKFEFCIINDFPLYEYDEENEKYIFVHNPFNMPHDGMEGLNKNPEDICAYQYDFVCNGYEMASGAVRNYNVEIFKKMFEIAGYGEEEIIKRFPSLYKAFQYGAPPHAGMAPGIDRILMLLQDETNIREVTLFPMSASGQDLLMGAPNEVEEVQLRETHIKVRD